MQRNHLNNTFFLKLAIPSITWSNTNWHLRRIWRTARVCLFFLALLACGQEEKKTGDYRANLSFPEDILRDEETSEIDCSASRIETFSFIFIVNGLQYGPYEFACKEHNAMINDVPAEKGIIVEVFADDPDGNAILEGSGVIDIPQENTDVDETIQMNYVSSEPATDTEVADKEFGGDWLIVDSPQGCAPYVSRVEYTSIILQDNGNATIITPFTEICSIPIEAQCTVSGDVMSCIPFEFVDDSQRIHRYSAFTLTYIDHDNLIGSNDWTIYWSGGGQACHGTSSLSGTRIENTED